MKKFSVLAAVFFLVCSFVTPNFVHAENNNTIVEDEFSAQTSQIEKYFKSLPQKKSYKVKQRPLMIQGAMNIEIETLVRALKNPVTYRFSNYLYIAGTYKNYPVVIVRTEQGMANSAASTAIGIEKFNPIAVINQGTAGGHVEAAHWNCIIIGEKNYEHTAVIIAKAKAGEGIDFTKQEVRGVYAYDKYQKKFRKYAEFLPDTKLFQIAKETADEHKEFNTLTGCISTADMWLNNVDYINFLNEKYGSLCEEMENHAAAQMCQNTDTPFIGIRVISNNIVNDEEWNSKTAETCQKFVLLVAEKFIADIQKK